MQDPLSRRRLLAAAIAWPVADGAAAAAAGPVTGDWTDPARQRRIPWLLRLPADSGPWPLVLYSHGLGGSREGGGLWGAAWAEAGIAVLHLQHAGSDSQTLRGGLQALRAAAGAEQLIARVSDMRFALDELARRSAAGEAPWAALRGDATGVAGHSFGAVTTQALAGERYAGGRAVDEPRPRAFIAFSPSSRTGRRSVQDAFGGVTRPFLGVTGSLDGDPLGGSQSSAARAAVYDGLPRGRRALLWLDGADHGTCGGGRPPGLGRATLQPRAAVTLEREAVHQALVARISTAWWRAHLAGDEAARAALRSPDGLGPGDRWRMD